MAGRAGSVLSAFIPALVLLVSQDVSDFMAGTTGSDLTPFTLTLVLLA